MRLLTALWPPTFTSSPPYRRKRIVSSVTVLKNSLCLFVGINYWNLARDFTWVNLVISARSRAISETWRRPYRVAQKNWHTFLYALTSYLILTDFQTYFTVWIWRLSLKSTTPQAYRYTLWNVSVLKATIENRTSETTQFRKLTTGKNVFIRYCLK